LFIVSLAAFLVPPPHASYAILSIGGRPLLLSADTAMIAGATLLNLIVMIVFALALGVGRARDNRTRLARMIATQPASLRSIGAGRFLATILFASAITIAAMLVLSLTIGWRHGAPPSATAFVLFLCLVFPGCMLGCVVAMLTDIVWPLQPPVRALAAFMIWLGAILLSIGNIVDLSGTEMLSSLIGIDTDSQSLSLGFISTNGRDFQPWHDLVPSHDFALFARFGVGFVLFLVGLISIIILSPRLQRSVDFDRRADSNRLSPSATSPEPDLPEMPAIVPLLKPYWAGYLVLARLFQRSRAAPALAIIGCLGGVFELPGSINQSLVLLVPFLLFGQTDSSEVNVAATIEKTVPGLAYPDPFILMLIALSATMGLAMAPTLIGFPIVQALTALCSILTLNTWMIWTHRILHAPLLGFSVAGILLYVIAWNNVPLAIDLFGISGSSLSALTLQICLLAILSGAIWFSGRLRIGK
jgi:hypothetical protein